MSSFASPIESPCVQVCRLEPALGLCVGCGRTLDEIAGWVGMGAAERRRVIGLLPPRLAALPRPPKDAE